jgi:Protein of unknown function (DUF2442)
MKSVQPGTSTSGAELTNVSQHGPWLLVDGTEHYLPFDQFPWFLGATMGQLSRIERPSAGHLRWPGLDIDLSIDSIEDPSAFPLVSQPDP